MKIMDLSGDDEECKIDTVISSKTKKTMQERLPFQTIGTDSPIANKKRKSHASPDVRNPKQPKVTSKENSLKKSKKTEIKTIVDIEDEVVEEKSENKNNLKQDKTKETPDSKSKKATPGKGSSTKTKKSETKVQANTLIKFFKKIDNKDNKEANNKPETTVSEDKESEKKSDINNKSEETSEKSSDKTKDIDVIDILTESDDENTPQNENSKKSLEKSKEIENNKVENKSEDESILEECNDTESKNSLSSDENKQSHTDTSRLNESEKIEVDSDISDDSQDEDVNDDSSKSDTDNKKTEHEDTDSKDDSSRSSKILVLTPTRSKLLDSGTKEKKLTPKQIEKRLENQKKREMREKQRLEREKKLHEERESRKKEKEEKRREREEKEKALKEQKRKERELKELKKQAEIEQKQKEKEAKEEDRRKREEAKEEEKKKKEEERLEAERKKQKAASNFVSFFVAKKSTDPKPSEEEVKVEETKNFMPFEIKADMKVAPTTRRTFPQSEKSKLDELISRNVDRSKLYINEIKSKNYSIRKSEKTWPFETNDDVVVIDEEEESSKIVQTNKTVREKHRPKLLLFHENRRPPYWGTWRKKSKTINPRKPLAKDTDWFDYEIDSDDEWEEEEPGESLHGSDDEKEKDEDNAEENEYDVDNDFMVPHGYLSEEEVGADEDDDEEDELNPENQKKKLKILGEQFEAEMKTKTQKLKPKVIGCVWLTSNNAYPKNLPTHTVQFMTARHAWVREIPLALTAPADADYGNENECGTPSSKLGVMSSARKARVLEEVTPDLIRLFHGNTHNRGFLLKEFVEYLSKKREGEKPIAKMKLSQKIKEIASWINCPEPGPMQDKLCWFVAEEHRLKYLPTEKLPLPNQWTYCLSPKKKSVVAEMPDKSTDKEKEKEKKTVPLITQFTKTLTAEEKQKQLTEKPPTPAVKVVEKSASSSISKPTTPLNRPPKRVSLISVPRGESFPKSPRVSLIDKFVTKDGSGNDSKKSEKPRKEDLDNDDCMIIDDNDENIDVTAVDTSEEKQTVESENEAESKNGDADDNIKSDQDESLNESENSEIEIVDV